MQIKKVEDQIQLIDNEVMIGHLDFHQEEDLIYINGVVVDEKYRNQGLARKLVDEVVSYIKANQLKAVPVCPYVVALFDSEDFSEIDARKKGA